VIEVIAAHLWQSTLFGAAAGLLTLAFRSSQARVRYWMWLTASLKFVIPFTLLTNLGSHVHILAPSSVQEIAATTPNFFSYTVEYFSQRVLPQGAEALASSSKSAFSPALLVVGVWGCGVICLALIRLHGWRRIRGMVRASLATDLPVPVNVRSSPELSEPAVIGLIRPVLLLPQGITERLKPSEMNAILAHELCHIRRRDNLLAFLHMVVETMFWFHPLVWWIGARLIEERERACDEDVVSQGNPPEVYAEAILSVCKLYVESPRICACGATGATLRRRIEMIMTDRVAEKLNRIRKVLLVAAGAASVGVPLAIGVIHGGAEQASTAPFVPQSQSSSFELTSVKPSARPAKDLALAQSTTSAPEFDSASLKPADSQPGRREGPPGGVLRFTPGRVIGKGVSARRMILEAYHLSPYQLSGGPGWLESERFSIEAKGERADQDQLRLMLQTLLSQRLKLVVHRDSKQMSVYDLVVAKSGPKLLELKGSEPSPSNMRELVSRGVAMPRLDRVAGVFYDRGNFRSFVDTLNGTGKIDRPILDQTGLKGTYLFFFQWDSEENLIAEIEEQSGLRFESHKGQVNTVVVDHIERLDAN
jgi:bla regulator protein blaR1